MVVGAAAVRRARPVGARSVRDVDLASNDRFDPRGVGGVVELDRAEEIPVVRERERRHLHRRGARDQTVQAACAVQERVVAVVMKVDEGRAHRRLKRPPRRGRARRSAVFGGTRAVYTSPFPGPYEFPFARGRALCRIRA
jgi:hypothetical protein